MSPAAPRHPIGECSSVLLRIVRVSKRVIAPATLFAPRQLGGRAERGPDGPGPADPVPDDRWSAHMSAPYAPAPPPRGCPWASPAGWHASQTVLARRMASNGRLPD